MPDAASKPFRVFYSWQSDLPKEGNERLIRAALDAALAELNGDHDLHLNAARDEATRDLPGSPNIAEAIFAKIRQAEVFVCDLSKVAEVTNEAGERRNYCNPNVAIELGYAIRVLGWERIVLVFNTAYGKLPGDEWNANKCVPEPLNGGVAGDPCAIEGDDMFTGLDNCAEGYICLNVDSEQKNGACIEFCTSEMTCPNTSGGDGVCIVTNDGALPICLALCDPLLQDCAGQGACYGDPSGPPFVCFNPDPKDGGQDGGACDFTNACLKGLNCAQADTQEGCVTDQFGCCAPFCDITEMTCTGAEECLPFFMEPQPGFENLGICALPG